MKIIRHLTPGGPAHAALQPDGSALAIAGDILGEFKVTDRVVIQGKRLAPIVPPNILAIGLNYKKHAEEGGRGVPARPMLFIKGTNALQNPGDPIEIPVKLASTEVDFECEIAVVIGKRCKNATKANALDYVLGYTCANDVSARDWQQRLGGGQFCQGKSFDTFCPLGPVLVTADEIPNPNALAIRTISERRRDAGLEHERHGLRHSDADRISERQQNAPSRHGHPDGHSPRGRVCAETPGFHEGRGHRQHRNRGNWNPDKSGRGRAV